MIINPPKQKNLPKERKYQNTAIMTKKDGSVWKIITNKYGRRIIRIK